MESDNRLNRTLKKLDSVPSFARGWMRNKAIGRAVPFVGTAGLNFVTMAPDKVEISVANVRKVQNHIDQVHAAATALLAETASGMVVGMNIPDDKIPLIKSIHTQYVKRSSGAMKAVATLSPEQIQEIKTTEKGDLPVKTIITDETEEEVVIAEMIWAWITKKER